MACVVSESRCVGAGLFEGVIQYLGGCLCRLVPETWSHRGWGFMSLVEEVNPLAPKVVGTVFRKRFRHSNASVLLVCTAKCPSPPCRIPCLHA